MYLIPIQHPAETFLHNDCWQVYALSADKEGKQCDFLEQVSSLDPAYVDDFFTWLLHFQRLCGANPRRPMKELIRDPRKFHDVGTVSLTPRPGVATTETVWQFTHDRIRVLWCYTGDGRILLTGRVLIKKTQKIKKADLKVVEKAMQAYLDAKRTGDLEVIAGG